MKSQKLLTAVKWGILASVTVLALPDFALASAGDSLESFTDQDASMVVPLISVASYTIGAFLGVSGALKLKKHAENPAQEKLAPGIAALLAGGGLVALPSLMGTLKQTAHLGTTTATYMTMEAPIP